MKNIFETLVSTPDLSTLVTAVKAADLTATLSGPGPFTLFAPTNEAFAKVPAADLESLLANKGKLSTVLTSHVAARAITSKDIANAKSHDVLAVAGNTLLIDTTNDTTIDKAKIVTADITCSNGVIHTINTVLKV
jgi:uncharacterized surface protein with fasciclin (FAS1) repeats